MERVNITEEELESMMDVETYLTAEQAVEQGFADEVSKQSRRRSRNGHAAATDTAFAAAN